MHSLTRRSLVAAAPAAIVASAAPALARDDRDAALLALREPYDRTVAAIAEVSPAHSRAEEAYFALKRERPDLDQRALRKESGLFSAERAWQRANTASLAIIHQIAELPAHSSPASSSRRKSRSARAIASRTS